MTDPIPGQLALDPDLAPDVAATDRLQRPTSPANGAGHAIDGPNGQGAFLASLRGVACPVGLSDVPAALRVFADVDAGQLMTCYWRAWSPDTDPAAAALAYRERLGTWPATVTRNPRGGAVLAGPVTLTR